jgi:hypothetical protein
MCSRDINYQLAVQPGIRPIKLHKLSTIQVCSFLVHQIQTRFVVFSSSCVQSVEAEDDPFPDEQSSEDVFFPPFIVLLHPSS